MSARHAGREFERVQRARAIKESKAVRAEQEKKNAQIKAESGGLRGLEHQSVEDYIDNESLEDPRVRERSIRRPIAELDTKPVIPIRTRNLEPPTPPPSAVWSENGLEFEGVAGLRAELEDQKNLVATLRGQLDAETTGRKRLQDEKREVTRNLTKAYKCAHQEEIEGLKGRVRDLAEMVDEASDEEMRLQKQFDEGRRREDALIERLQEMKLKVETSRPTMVPKHPRQTDMSDDVSNDMGRVSRVSRVRDRYRGTYISTPKGRKLFL